MNFIEAALIEINIKQTRNQIKNDFIAKRILSKPFFLGKSIFNRSHSYYVISRIENSTHFYEWNADLNKIKIISRLSNDVIETNENLKFLAKSNAKIIFPKASQMNQNLFGLNEIETRLINHLNSKRNELIALYGPDGNGKSLLLKKLEDVLDRKHFFHLSYYKTTYLKSYLKDLFDNIRYIKSNVVFCIHHSEDMVDDDIDHDHLIYMIRELMFDQFLDLKIIITINNKDMLHPDLQYLISFNIFVRDLDKFQKLDLLKYCVEQVSKQKLIEDGLMEFTNCLRGFSAKDIIDFIVKVHHNFREISLENLKYCIKIDEYSPSHLLNLSADIEPVHWCDIGGYDEVKELLNQEIQEPLNNGGKIIKGLLLYGPPGCSKTMFAKALATECGLRLFTIRPSNVMRSLVGESEELFRRILLQALASAPSIIFIDEIDTLLPQRTSSMRPSVSEHLLNELITFLDGVDSKKDNQVIVMGATNRIDRVDEALIRPGRMDLKIEIARPGQQSREQILKIIFSNPQLVVEPEIIDEIRIIAAMLGGKSGASIVNMGRNLQRLSTHCCGRSITLCDVIQFISTRDNF